MPRMYILKKIDNHFTMRYNLGIRRKSLEINLCKENEA